MSYYVYLSILEMAQKSHFVPTKQPREESIWLVLITADLGLQKYLQYAHALLYAQGAMLEEFLITDYQEHHC